MTPMMIPMMTPMMILTIQMGPTKMNRDDDGQFGNTAKSLDLYRSDEDLGDLDWRFSDDKGRFAMDEEVCCLHSRLVIMDLDNGAEHVLHVRRPCQKHFRLCVSWTDAVYHVKGGEELVEAVWVI
jgi:hypothetical protein